MLLKGAFDFLFLLGSSPSSGAKKRVALATLFLDIIDKNGDIIDKNGW